MTLLFVENKPKTASGKKKLEIGYIVLGFSVVPEVISGRTGNTNVRTVSGLSTGISTLTKSGLAEQNPALRESERKFPPVFLFPVYKLLPVGLAFPVFRQNFGPPVYAT